MPFNGAGRFNLSSTLQPNTTAAAGDVDAILADIALGLSDCLTRDGQGPATAPAQFGGFSLQQIGNPVNGSDAVNLTTLRLFLPSGTPLPWLTGAVPPGFILAYGQVLSQTAYAGIFAAFGTQFNTGGEGSGNFRMPDMRGVVLAGVDNMGGTPKGLLNGFGSGGTVVGATGGEQAHSLTSAENGPHNHTATDSGHTHTTTDPGHAHNYTRPNNPTVAFGGGSGSALTSNFIASTDAQPTGITINSGSANITVASSGSGNGHNNVQPTMLVNWIIKT